MSRIGKQPVTIPNGVDVAVNGRAVSVKGKNGALEWDVPHDISVEMADGVVTFTPKKDTKRAASAWGLSRAMVQNMVTGVSEGFKKELEIKGVGYRAAMQGTNLNLSLGFSHPVNMDVPTGLTVEVNDGVNIVVTGFDKCQVGQFAANVRRVRPVEPYKGKGVRYKGEHVVMKEGKKK